ncbi:MAG: glycoside hydrolase family 97 N-terminal domain-containing protein, partial [Tannerella sp.]|nr:glycoside hydrolase family 97 N-terminal domain-containing protein [Tannerella sp.]
MKTILCCVYALGKSMRTVAIALLAIGLYACMPGEKKIVSPNGKINLSVRIEDSNGKGYGKALFTIDYMEGMYTKNILYDAVLGMEAGQRKFDDLKLLSVSDDLPINEDYRMITGKKSRCTNKGVERTYRFENEQQQILQVAFRVYNDGVAFRYGLDAVGPGSEYITDELTTYPVPDGTKRWMQQYVNDYEGFFPLATNGEDVEERNSHTWGYPALIEPQEQVFLLISEAGITRNQSASRLVNSDNRNEYRVRMADEKVAFNGSYCSPWRVLIIGSLADVVESTLVTDVSEPNKVADTDWIIPGPVAWIYWAHNHSSKDFQVVKEYIDLAARMKWPYDL